MRVTTYNDIMLKYACIWIDPGRDKAAISEMSMKLQYLLVNLDMFDAIIVL